MSSKVIPVLCASCVVLFAAALIWEPAAQGTPQVPVEVAQGDTGPPASDPQQAISQQTKSQQIDAALAARLGNLEQTMQHLVRRGELDRLRSRVAELERTQRNNSQSLDSGSRSQANDIAQLKSDIASLKRLHSQLASKVANARNQSYPTRNDLRVLQQKVFSLQNTVDRLESRR